MAYTVTLTKESVVQSGNGSYTITFLASVSDGVDTVFEEFVSGRYNPNAPDLEDTKDQIRDVFTDRWDKWAEENGILTSAALDAALSALQTQAQTYVNA